MKSVLKALEQLDNFTEDLILSDAQKEFFKDSVVRDANDQLKIVYRGTKREFNSSRAIVTYSWFSSSSAYAHEFADAGDTKGFVAECYLNITNLFDCGNTDGYIFNVALPIKPYKFSADMRAIIKKLNADEEEIRKMIKDVAQADKQEYCDYKMKIFTLVRTQQFRDLLEKKGYNGIRTVESKNESYGAMFSNQIKAVTNKNPTLSQDINK